MGSLFTVLSVGMHGAGMSEVSTGDNLVFEATGKPSLIDLGIALTRPFGTMAWQGHYGEGPVQFEFVRAHHRQLWMLLPSDDGLAECRAALLRSIQAGRFPLELLIPDKLSPGSAGGFFEQVIRKGSGDSKSPAIAWGVIA
jgi:threonine dehydrogenase-like Zn-dependent dehydrogenase